MSAQSRMKRLEKLEQTEAPYMPNCIIHTFFRPSEDGPVECGGTAEILKGKHAGLKLKRGEDETRDEFKSRIDQHIEGVT